MADPASAQTIPRGRRLALAVLCAVVLMTIVDETVVSVAAPTIQRELGFSTDGLAWLVNAYLVGFGGLLLLAGRLGDLLGRRRTLLGGVAVFTVASAACAVAVTPAWLVAARFAQGVGAAFAAGVALGLVAALFPEAGPRARAMAIYAAVGAAGASIGLALGGLLTDVAGWRSAFVVNLPVGLAVVLVGRRVLADDRPRAATGADVTGGVLLVGGVMLLVTAIAGIRDAGLAAAQTVGPAAAAATLLGLFVAREARVGAPLVPLGFLRSRVVAGVNVAHALFVGAMFGFQFLVALYLQQVLGLGPARAGLAVVPIAIGIAATSMLLYGRLAARVPARHLLVGALVLVAAGLALLTRVRVEGDYVADVLPSVLLFAVGGGLALPAITTLAIGAAKPADAGLASGLITSSQQVGGALGLAVIAALAAGKADTATAAGAMPAEALVEGFRLGWTVGAGFALAAALLVALALRPRAAATAAARAAEPGAAHPAACRG